MTDKKDHPNKKNQKHYYVLGASASLNAPTDAEIAAASTADKYTVTSNGINITPHNPNPIKPRDVVLDIEHLKSKSHDHDYIIKSSVNYASLNTDGDCIKTVGGEVKFSGEINGVRQYDVVLTGITVDDVAKMAKAFERDKRIDANEEKAIENLIAQARGEVIGKLSR